MLANEPFSPLVMKGTSLLMTLTVLGLFKIYLTRNNTLSVNLVTCKRWVNWRGKRYISVLEDHRGPKSKRAYDEKGVDR